MKRIFLLITACICCANFLWAQKLDTLYLDSDQNLVAHPAFAKMMRVVLIEKNGAGKYLHIDMDTGRKRADGSFSSINLETGEMIRQGKVYVYDVNTGKPTLMITFSNNKYHGEFVYFSDDGGVWYVETYQNGYLHGETKEYFPSGKLKVIKHYKFNKLDGPCEVTDENGRKMTGNYVNGLEEGIFKYYSEFGQFIGQERYVKGVKQSN